MPEAAIDKDGESFDSEGNIWLAGDSSVEAVAPQTLSP